MTIEQLDEVTTEIAARVSRAFADPWHHVRYVVRWNPKGDTSAYEYWVKHPDGTERKDYPDTATSLALSDASHRHWRLTQQLGQSRWYQMTVTVHRDGKYSVDFEYRDDYQEGDIMKPLE